MLDNKYFGIILTFATFEIGKMINNKLKSPIANPLLISIAICILFLNLLAFLMSPISKAEILLCSLSHLLQLPW